MGPSTLLLFWIDFLTSLFPLLITLHGSMAGMISIGQFTESSNLEQLVEVYKTGAGFRSCAQCAMACVSTTPLTALPCVAFHCQQSVPMTMTCDFYTKSNTPVPAPGIHIFWFQVTDVFHTVTVEGRDYSVFLSSVKKTFPEARSHCHHLGGFLLQFESPQEHDAVRVITSRAAISQSFVGANDIEVEGRWVTDREGTVLDPELWPWHAQNPDNHLELEHCAALIHRSSGINDDKCYHSYTFLCERDGV